MKSQNDKKWKIREEIFESTKKINSFKKLVSKIIKYAWAILGGFYFLFLQTWKPTHEPSVFQAMAKLN